MSTLDAFQSIFGAIPPAPPAEARPESRPELALQSLRQHRIDTRNKAWRSYLGFVHGQHASMARLTDAMQQLGVSDGTLRLHLETVDRWRSLLALPNHHNALPALAEQKTRRDAIDRECL